MRFAAFYYSLQPCRNSIYVRKNTWLPNALKRQEPAITAFQCAKGLDKCGILRPEGLKPQLCKEDATDAED